MVNCELNPSLETSLTSYIEKYFSLPITAPITKVFGNIFAYETRTCFTKVTTLKDIVSYRVRCGFGMLQEWLGFFWWVVLPFWKRPNGFCDFWGLTFIIWTSPPPPKKDILKNEWLHVILHFYARKVNWVLSPYFRTSRFFCHFLYKERISLF